MWGFLGVLELAPLNPGTAPIERERCRGGKMDLLLWMWGTPFSFS
jgi:hypothetical protein